LLYPRRLSKNSPIWSVLMRGSASETWKIFLMYDAPSIGAPAPFDAGV